MLRVGSLFSGYSGIEIALSMLWDDVQPVWFVENDKHAAAILAKHFASVPNHGDITRSFWEY